MPEQLVLPSKIQLVCIGKAYAGKEICLVFRLVGTDGLAGEERLYAQKRLKQVRVGNVYEVETSSDDPTRLLTNTIRWIRIWNNKAEAAIWQTEAAAFDTLELAKQCERRESTRRLPLELLRPLRDEYWKTNSSGRLAIEVRVLAYLRMVPLRSGE